MTKQVMLAALSAETAKPPTGLYSPPASELHHHHHEPTPAEEAECKGVAETAAAKRPMEIKLPGKGCAFAYTKGPFCSYSERDGVFVLFSGEVAKWPGIDRVEDAHDAFVSNVQTAEDSDAGWLIDFYDSFINSKLATSPSARKHHRHGHNDDSGGDAGDEVLERALECLAAIEGSFSFVILDSVFHRVLAARDAEGSRPLYWGSTEDGMLIFGSDVDDLAMCNPTATMFPPGSLFASTRHTQAYCPGPEGWVIEGDDLPGEMLSFIKAADHEHWKTVQAIPRLTSQGCVTGAVYKVSSQPDLVHTPAAHAH